MRFSTKMSSHCSGPQRPALWRLCRASGSARIGRARTNGKPLQVELRCVARALVPEPQAVRHGGHIVTSIGLPGDEEVVVDKVRVGLEEVEHEVQHVVRHACNHSRMSTSQVMQLTGSLQKHKPAEMPRNVRLGPVTKQCGLVQHENSWFWPRRIYVPWKVRST